MVIFIGGRRRPKETRTPHMQNCECFVMIDSRASIKRTLSMPDARLKLLEEKLCVGTWSLDLQTLELVWSPGLFRILGLAQGSVAPSLDLYQQMVHPNDQIEFTDSLGFATDPKLEGRRFRIIRPDGSLRWLENKAQRHFDRDGRAILITGVIADITEHEQTRSELTAKERQVRLIQELVNDVVWRAYPDGKLIETKFWTDLTGETPAEAHDWDRLTAIHPEDRDTFRRAWANALEQGQKFGWQHRIRLRNGHYQKCTHTAVPVKDENGQITSWLGITKFASSASEWQDVGSVTSAQIRAARALLGWTAEMLAHKAEVSFSSVRRLETDTQNLRPETVATVRHALVAAGISFLSIGEGAFGVSIQQAQSQSHSDDSAPRSPDISHREQFLRRD